MKKLNLVNMLEFKVADHVRDLLSHVPTLEIDVMVSEAPVGPDERIDTRVDFNHGSTNYTLVIEMKTNGAPRFVRSAIYRLESYTTRLRRTENPISGRQFIPMLFSSYLSPESRAICADHNVAYLDQVGNAHLAFGDVYIDRTVAEKPKSEFRALRSIFSPRAGAILRVMLREPGRAWRVADLAEKANASLGHVSNVGKKLFERDWVEKGKEGIVLVRPDSLVKNWRENYRRPVGRRVTGYTHLHGKQLDDSLLGLLNPNPPWPRLIYSLNSAASWLAPYIRDGTNWYYADDQGAELLRETLKLKTTTKGANVILRIPLDESLFEDAIEPSRGIYCTSPIITYLDLWNGNDREREAAELLAEEYFPWL